jgi:hypothetical protein
VNGPSALQCPTLEPMPAGGHFAAMEKPKLLVDEVRAFSGVF